MGRNRTGDRLEVETAHGALPPPSHTSHVRSTHSLLLDRQVQRMQLGFYMSVIPAAKFQIPASCDQELLVHEPCFYLEKQ